MISRVSSQTRDQTHVSYVFSMGGGFFTTGATWEAGIIPSDFHLFQIYNSLNGKKKSIPWKTVKGLEEFFIQKDKF